LLKAYARARGLSASDAEEVRDACLAIVARRIGTFEYERAKGSFKGWLYRIAHGKVVDLLRRAPTRHASTETLLAIEDREDADRRWEELWRREHLRHALEDAKRRESAAAVRVFELLLLDGLSVAEVCERTGLASRQVYKARARMLHRVRAALRRL